MTDRVVRATTDERVTDARTVRHEVFVVGQDVPEELEYDDWDEDERTVHLVAYEAEGNPVGAARLSLIHI